MKPLRTFIAIEIDEGHKQKISEVICALKKSDADVKWITENQMHLTLKFMGNTEENNILPISNALKSIADNFKPFGIRLLKLGVFPNIKSPRVIWLGIEKGADTLKLLNNKIEAKLEGLGIPRENREYNSHITLGRVKTNKNISQLIELINPEPRLYKHGFGSAPFRKNITIYPRLHRRGFLWFGVNKTELLFKDEFEVTNLTFFQSNLSPTGAIYTVLGKFPFLGKHELKVVQFFPTIILLLRNP